MNAACFSKSPLWWIFLTLAVLKSPCLPGKENGTQGQVFITIGLAHHPLSQRSIGTYGGERSLQVYSILLECWRTLSVSGSSRPLLDGNGTSVLLKIVFTLRKGFYGG
jgi:hypothetical protein